MSRFFNTAGPVNARDHYVLSPIERICLPEILSLIEQKKYFVLHAPRQTGKTSSLLALQSYLNDREQYRCLYGNVEPAQAARENVADAIRTILHDLAYRALEFEWGAALDAAWPALLDRAGPYSALGTFLTHWTQISDRPTILLLDEIDSLVGDTLISALRQIRAGYDKRPDRFPQSIVLCGVRDVRDYRLHTDGGKAVITGGSAFNIKAESLRLGNFTRPEVETLYRRHTDETGQSFEPDALELAWELTRGQPWLVNALAYEACFKLSAGRDRSRSITGEMLQEAKERIVLRRETHLDQLIDKLKEPRVHRVINPMLQGRDLDQEVLPDDIEYTIDLGLVTRTGMGLQVANPIYREIIPRELNWIAQLNFESTIQPAWYIADDGRLEMEKLLFAFQQFFRENSEQWVERFQYKEAGPQLMLQAFLQRIVNGGGRVDREYGLGRKRTDLLIVWPYEQGIQRVVLELKIRYGGLDAVIRDGVQQTWEYMDRCGAASGHLLIFNRDPEVPWDQKVFKREEAYQGQKIHVWGM